MKTLTKGIAASIFLSHRTTNLTSAQIARKMAAICEEIDGELPEGVEVWEPLEHLSISEVMEEIDAVAEFIVEVLKDVQ